MAGHKSVDERRKALRAVLQGTPSKKPPERPPMSQQPPLVSRVENPANPAVEPTLAAGSLYERTGITDAFMIKVQEIIVFTDAIVEEEPTPAGEKALRALARYNEEYAQIAMNLGSKEAADAVLNSARQKWTLLQQAAQAQKAADASGGPVPQPAVAPLSSLEQLMLALDSLKAVARRLKEISDNASSVMNMPEPSSAHDTRLDPAAISVEVESGSFRASEPQQVQESPAKKPRVIKRILTHPLTWLATAWAGFSGVLHATDSFQLIEESFKKLLDKIPNVPSTWFDAVPNMPYSIPSLSTEAKYYAITALCVLGVEFFIRHTMNKEVKKEQSS